MEKFYIAMDRILMEDSHSNKDLTLKLFICIQQNLIYHLCSYTCLYNITILIYRIL